MNKQFWTIYNIRLQRYKKCRDFSEDTALKSEFFHEKIFFEGMLCVMKKVVFLQPQIQRGAVAQLVEQRTENPCVTGSTPVSATPQKKDRKCGPFLFFVIIGVNPLNHRTVVCIFFQVVHRFHRNAHLSGLPPIPLYRHLLHTSFELLYNLPRNGLSELSVFRKRCIC